MLRLSRILSAFLTTGRATNVFRALKIPSISTAHTIFHPPTLRPRTLLEARSIIKDRFAAIDRYVVNQELTRASTTTVVSLNGEFANNGYVDASGDAIYDVNGAMDRELEAAMMDEVVEQHKNWNVQDKPGVLFFSGANAVSISSEEMMISGSVSSSEEPNFFVTYDKNAYSTIDGLNRRDAKGRAITTSGLRFVSGSGPVYMPLIDQLGRAALGINIICLDYKKFGAEFARTDAKNRKGMVGFLMGLGSPSPKPEAAAGLSVVSYDTADLLPKTVDDSDHFRDTFVAIDRGAADNTGIWEKAKSDAFGTQFAGAIISRYPSLLDGVQSCFGLFDVSVKSKILALSEATTGQKKPPSRFTFTKQNRETGTCYASGPHSLADALTDERIAQIAKDIRDGKVVVGGLSRIGLTIEQLEASVKKPVAFGPDPKTSGDPSKPDPQDAGQDTAASSDRPSTDPNRSDSGPDHGGRVDPGRPSDPSHGEPGHIDPGDPDPGGFDPRHADPSHPDSGRPDGGRPL